MNCLLRALGFFQLAGLAGVTILLLSPGRPEANAHPDDRGGGDHGFGGSDFYAEAS